MGEEGESDSNLSCSDIYFWPEPWSDLHRTIRPSPPCRPSARQTPRPRTVLLRPSTPTNSRARSSSLLTSSSSRTGSQTPRTLLRANVSRPPLLLSRLAYTRSSMTAKAPSVRRACTACHAGKTRCSDVLPCQVRIHSYLFTFMHANLSPPHSHA